MTQSHAGGRNPLPPAHAAAHQEQKRSSSRCSNRPSSRLSAWQINSAAPALLLPLILLAVVTVLLSCHGRLAVDDSSDVSLWDSWPRGQPWAAGSAAQRRLLQQGQPPAFHPQGSNQSAVGSDMQNYTTQGTSYNNPHDFPVPAGYEPVMSAVHRIVGPYVITDREDMEKAFQKAFANYYQPLGIEVRWLNYTARPATNFGPVGSFLRASMRAVDEQVLMYQKKGVGAGTNLTLGSVFNQTAYLQQLVTVEYGFSDASLVVLSERAVSPSFLESQGEYGGASTTIELYGSNLDPFTVDKQNVVLLTLTTVFNALDANPVFYVNISNFQPNGQVELGAAPNGQDAAQAITVAPTAAPAGRRRARRLMAAPPQPSSKPGLPPGPPGPPLGSSSNPVIIDVWTGLDPLRSVNLVDLWNRTLNQANAQQLYVINGDGGIGVAYTYRNFTATSQYYGVALVGKYQGSSKYQRSANGDYTVLLEPNGTVSSPATPKPTPSKPTSSPSSPNGMSNFTPGADFVNGIGNPNVGLPLNATYAQAPRRKKKTHNTGAIVGSTIGAFVAGVLLLAIIVGALLLRKRRRDAAVAAGKHTASSSDDGSPASSESGVGHRSWRWDARDSGVVEPVPADSPLGRVDLFPSLHRADQLFANDTANDSHDSLGTMTPMGSSLGSARGSGLTDSPRGGGGGGGEKAASSGPFVAGELDPVEIEICRDAEGKKVVLGEGAFGRVYKGLRRGVHEVAVKQLGNLKDPQLIRQFRKEIAILGRVSFQPNIVNFYGACLRNPNNIMLVMELMEGGDLRHALSADETGEYSWWGKGRSLALDIAHGLHFLHSSGVTHRDLKTSNILLSKGGTTAKIGDVGLAKITLTDLQSSLATVGTFVYAAPELLMGDRCTEKADCFSFGVCLWEICTRDIPMRGYLRDVHAPAECPEDIRALLADCMASDPAKRPSAEELVRRIAAAPHSREEAEAAMHAAPQESVRSISLTGLRDPLATEGLRVSAADLAQHRASRLSVSSSAASPPQQPRTPFADSDGPVAGPFGASAEVSPSAEAGRSSEDDSSVQMLRDSATDGSVPGGSAARARTQDEQ